MIKLGTKLAKEIRVGSKKVTAIFNGTNKVYPGKVSVVESIEYGNWSYTDGSRTRVVKVYLTTTFQNGIVDKVLKTTTTDKAFPTSTTYGVWAYVWNLTGTSIRSRNIFDLYPELTYVNDAKQSEVGGFRYIVFDQYGGDIPARGGSTTYRTVSHDYWGSGYTEGDGVRVITGVSVQTNQSFQASVSGSTVTISAGNNTGTTTMTTTLHGSKPGFIERFNEGVTQVAGVASYSITNPEWDGNSFKANGDRTNSPGNKWTGFAAKYNTYYNNVLTSSVRISGNTPGYNILTNGENWVTLGSVSGYVVVYISNRATTVGPVRSATVKLTYQGLSSEPITITQEANAYTGIADTSFTVSTPTAAPASGLVMTYFDFQFNKVFTSGSKQYQQLSGNDPSVTKTITGNIANATINGTSITVASLGTTIKAASKSTVTFSGHDGTYPVSCSIEITQAKNDIIDIVDVVQNPAANYTYAANGGGSFMIPRCKYLYDSGDKLDRTQLVTRDTINQGEVIVRDYGGFILESLSLFKLPNKGTTVSPVTYNTLKLTLICHLKTSLRKNIDFTYAQAANSYVVQALRTKPHGDWLPVDLSAEVVHNRVFSVEEEYKYSSGSLRYVLTQLVAGELRNLPSDGWVSFSTSVLSAIRIAINPYFVARSTSIWVQRGSLVSDPSILVSQVAANPNLDLYVGRGVSVEASTSISIGLYIGSSYQTTIGLSSNQTSNTYKNLLKRNTTYTLKDAIFNGSSTKFLIQSTGNSAALTITKVSDSEWRITTNTQAGCGLVINHAIIPIDPGGGGIINPGGLSPYPDGRYDDIVTVRP